jgi:hypothetical protein
VELRTRTSIVYIQSLKGGRVSPKAPNRILSRDTHCMIEIHKTFSL